MVPVFKEWRSLKLFDTYFIRKMDISSNTIINIYEITDVF